MNRNGYVPSMLLNLETHKIFKSIDTVDYFGEYRSFPFSLRIHNLNYFDAIGCSFPIDELTMNI